MRRAHQQLERDKKQYESDTAEKILENLLNRFGSGVLGHQVMMRFEKRRQREDEIRDKLMDDLEILRRRSQPDEPNSRMKLAVASKFINGVKNVDLETRLATHYTPISTRHLHRKSCSGVQQKSITEASDEIRLSQKQLWQFSQCSCKPGYQLVQIQG